MAVLQVIEGSPKQNYKTLIERINSPEGKGIVYVMAVVGGKIKDGHSWCEGCNLTLPTYREFVRDYKDGEYIEFYLVSVGSRKKWEEDLQGEDNPFRGKSLSIQRLPTYIVVGDDLSNILMVMVEPEIPSLIKFLEKAVKIPIEK